MFPPSFVDGMRLKMPVGDPLPRVIYADKQYAIFPDISAYKPCTMRYAGGMLLSAAKDHLVTAHLMRLT